MSLQEAMLVVKNSKVGGYQDWRLPSIKELYSLILFTGSVRGERAIEPFINTRYFDQPLGNTPLRQGPCPSLCELKAIEHISS